MQIHFSRHFIMRLVMVMGAFVVGALLYDLLPDPMPTHWGIEGQVDGWSSKASGVWLVPVMALFMLFLFPVLAKIDPRRKHYAKFQPAWELIQTAIIGFLIYIYNLQLRAALHLGGGDFMVKGMLLAMGILFIIMGMAMPFIESNYFVGIRTPWTLDDSTVWKKTHELGGKMFMLAGAIFIAGAFCRQYFLGIIISAITLVALVPVVYSYLISKKN